MGRKRKTGQTLPHRVYEKHGAFYYVGPDNKWKRLGKTLAEVYRGLAELEAESKIGTMDALFARYLKEVTPTKSQAQQDNERLYAERLRPVFGNMRPQDVRPMHVRGYLDRRSGKVAANREKAMLSHLFTMAMGWGVVDKNPCKGVARNKERPRSRHVTNAEVNAVGVHASAWLRRFIRMAYYTGQRTKDVMSMTRGQINEEGISFRQSKTGKKLLVEWTSTMREVANDCLAHAGELLIFSNKGRPYASWALQSAWRRAINKTVEAESAAGREFEPFQIRDLRAKAASDGGDKGLLGHANKDFTRRVYIRTAAKVKPVA